MKTYTFYYEEDIQFEEIEADNEKEAIEKAIERCKAKGVQLKGVYYGSKQDWR